LDGNIAETDIAMPTKKDILKALEAMCDLYPDWRFGQMIANISYWALEPKPEAVWDVEDEQFLKAIRDHLQGGRKDCV
jgi:hypothetical protein